MSSTYCCFTLLLIHTNGGPVIELQCLAQGFDITGSSVLIVEGHRKSLTVGCVLHHQVEWCFQSQPRAEWGSPSTNRLDVKNTFDTFALMLPHTITNADIWQQWHLISLKTSWNMDSSDHRTCILCFSVHLKQVGSQRTLAFLCRMYAWRLPGVTEFQVAFLDATVSQRTPEHTCDYVHHSSVTVSYPTWGSPPFNTGFLPGLPDQCFWMIL